VKDRPDPSKYSFVDIVVDLPPKQPATVAEVLRRYEGRPNDDNTRAAIARDLVDLLERAERSTPHERRAAWLAQVGVVPDSRDGAVNLEVAHPHAPPVDELGMMCPTERRPTGVALRVDFKLLSARAWLSKGGYETRGRRVLHLDTTWSVPDRDQDADEPRTMLSCPQQRVLASDAEEALVVDWFSRPRSSALPLVVHELLVECCHDAFGHELLEQLRVDNRRVQDPHEGEEKELVERAIEYFSDDEGRHGA